MSFFFTEKKKELKQPGPKKLVPANKSSKEILNRLGCKACPLDKVKNCTPKFQPKLVDETDIYILGEQPSETDDDKGKHFTGKAGNLLRDVIDPSYRISYDYIIRDFSPDKTITQWVAMESCRELVTKSIQRAKPKVLLGLGILPLQWVLNSSDMIGLRGRIFSIKVGGHPCYFIPTYAPDFVIDQAFDKGNPLRSKLGHSLKFDVQKALSLLESHVSPQIDSPQSIRAGLQAFNGQQAGQLPHLLKLMGEAAKAPVRAIDLETSALRPYGGGKILTIAMSYGETNFAFAWDHQKAGWGKDQRGSILIMLEEFLASEGKIIAHNASFEIEWLISLLGRDLIVHDSWECTMMQAHFLDERRGKRGGNDEQFQPNPYQALDFLIKQYFGIAYKAQFNVNRKSMNESDLDETLLYNAADTKYTLRLYHTQKRALQQAGLSRSYSGAVQRQPTVALMQSMGIDVDQSANKTYRKKLGREIKEIEQQINELPEVQQFIKDRKIFNPASQPDLIKIFKDYIKVGKLLLDEKGKASTDKNVLSKINHPLAPLIDQYRNRSKLKSTYVDAFEAGKGELIYPDGKIHPIFNTTFAETGRTSSDSPNAQNFPSRNDKWVRKQIVPPKGHVLVAFDYGQLEACTAAMCTKDEVLIDALWNDYDIHMEWAIKAANIWPEFVGGLSNLKDKEIMKKFRSRIKNKLVFPVIFGATNKSVAGYLGAPQEKIDVLMKEFWKTFHGLDKWQRDLMNDYYNIGYVESPTGRRRNYPLTKNQAINHPIQSVACDIVCNSMVRLSKLAADTGNWAIHPIMNIHDDLSFSIPDQPKILEESIETIYRAMLAPVYDFINVPLSVTCSVGDNWLEMDEIGKFWSHKI